MRFGSPIPQRRARIEIIPLIDVMFFLLASFMMVSLSLQKLRTLRMDLPSATRATGSSKPELLRVGVRANGDIELESRHHSLPEFMEALRQRLGANTNLPVYIQADPMAAHGDVLRVVDSARSAGAARISFQLDTNPAGGR
jgi:biopolymer transport protein ExbD